MIFYVGIERWLHGHAIAWVHDYPGCYAYIEDPEQVFRVLPPAIQVYVAWIHQHGGDWLNPAHIEIKITETWNQYTINKDFEFTDEGFDINAWFHHDWKPLKEDDINRGLNLLGWSRADLLETIQGLDENTFHKTYPDERWSIWGILNHLGNAEWWILDRLGIAPPYDEIPKDAFQRLKVIRACTIEALPKLIGSQKVVGVEGEFWSPRKLLRRTIWHERDHTQHIHKLLSMNKRQTQPEE